MQTSKQLILLLDGTWNDADVGPADTNIVRLRELINRSLESEPVQSSSSSFASARKYEADGIQRLVFYERAVGTSGFRDQIYGGAFGEGLETTFVERTKFFPGTTNQATKYSFSAFLVALNTARSLVGMLGAAGLLRRECCTTDREQKVWEFYRTPVNDRLPAKFDELTPYVHDRGEFKLTCVGVFDTVGALGVPLPVFFRENREIYGFHDVELGSITECSLQALAVDEHREPFQATAWRKPKFKTFDPRMVVEQVWFPGAHADVGGGYVAEWDRIVKVYDRWRRQAALDDVTLDWMLRRVLARHPNFPVRLNDEVVDHFERLRADRRRRRPIQRFGSADEN
jgi:uncharacterized protein (DUF2235 family)